MKRVGLLLLLNLLIGQAWAANYSMINCTAPKGTSIQVYLNGKLINTKPMEEVRLKSRTGCNSIFISVVEISSGYQFAVQKDIDIESGYEVNIKIKATECGPEIILAPRYPLFSNYLYNKNRYAVQHIS